MVLSGAGTEGARGALGDLALDGPRGDAEAEPAAFAQLAPLELEVSVEGARQLLREQEPQPRAAELASHRVVGLDERLKELAALLGRDTDAGVLDQERELLRGAVRARRRGLALDGHLAALGELDGVPDQVDEDLPQPRRIGAHELGERSVLDEAEANAFLPRPQIERRPDVLEQPVEREGDPLDLHLVGLDLRQIEDIPEDLQELLPVALDPDEVVAHILARLMGIQRQIGEAEDHPSGVRISWLMFARNCVLVMFAASAARARRSTSWRASTCAVTS